MHGKNSVQILVDYITFTVGRECFLVDNVDPGEVDETDRGILQRLREVFGLYEVEFISRRGLYGYDVGMCKGGITLCWGGTDTIMIQMSGEGCRLYESINPTFDWLSLIQLVLGMRKHNFSRLDIACDTFGQLNMRKLIDYTLSQRYVSQFVDYLVGQGNKEESIIFGSPSSRMRLRIYNKTMERVRELGTTEGVPTDWIRLEFQLRNAAADSFIRSWITANDISVVYFGIIANQLRYVKERETNVSRSVMTSWWRKFLGNAGAIKIAYQGGLEYNLQSLQKYVFGQAGSSIRTWCELTDYDMDKLIAIVREKKLNERQKSLIEVLAEMEHET